mgnify:FL=1
MSSHSLQSLHQWNALTLVKLAKADHTAVCAFNVIMIEHAESYAQAAEAAGQPLILQISENAVKYHGSLKPILVASKAIAETCKQRLSIHLDHAESTDLIKEALDLGADSVMFDGSKLDYIDNVRTSIKMRELAHSYGACIEVELGEIGGKDGVHAPGVRTQPHEAKKFVAETGVDMLAVAVGSSHAMTTRDAALDFELIKEIATEVHTPLVLHGSSGVSDADLQTAVHSGISKVNIATHLNHVFTDSIRATLNEDPKLVDPRKYLKKSRDAVATESSRLIKLLATRPN